MQTNTHALFDTQSRFLEWIVYSNGTYQSESMEWGSLNSLERFFTNCRLVGRKVTSFDDLTDEQWAVIADATNEYLDKSKAA